MTTGLTHVSRPQVDVTHAEHQSTISALAWSPDGTRIVSGDDAGVVKVWTVVQGKTLATFQDEQRAAICAVDWSVDGLIAVGGRSPRLQLVEGESLRKIHEWPLRAAPARPNGPAKYGRPHLGLLALAWSPKGRLLLGGGFDGQGDQSLYLWQAMSGAQQTLDQVKSTIYSVAWSPDGQRFAAAGDFGALGMWSASGKSYPVLFSGASPQSFFSALAWSPDGQRLAACGLPSHCTIWYGSGELATWYQGHHGPTWRLSWSPESERMASVGHDHTIQLWDAATGQCLSTYAYPLETCPRLAWSPDGTRIAVPLAHQVQVWKV